MTIEEYFKNLASELELTKGERDRISTKHRVLRKKLHSSLSVEDSFLTGSYARNTMIRPEKGSSYDVDLFLVFNDKDFGSYELPDLVALVEKSLEGIKEEDEDINDIVTQKRSVAVVYGNGFQIDVVPAIQIEKDEKYKIYDKKSRKAIESNPKNHSNTLTLANETTAAGSIKRLVPIVKLLKSWRRKKCDYIKSFHLEMLVVKTLQDSEIPSFSVGIAKFFKELGNYLQRACLKDPANGSNIIDAYLDEDNTRNNILILTAGEAEIAKKALQLEENDDIVKALQEWRKIFGNENSDSGKSDYGSLSSSGPIIISRTPSKPWCNV